MTGRNYDWKLTLDNISNFEAGNTLIGNTTIATSQIANVDSATSSIKVKMTNTHIEYLVGEAVHSNVVTFISQNVSVSYNNSVVTIVDGNNYIINGSTSTFAIPEAASGNILKDSIIVRLDGRNIKTESFIYPAATSLGKRGITISGNPPSSSIKSIVVQVMSANLEAETFSAAYVDNQLTTATANITSIQRSPYIAEKNAFTQNPLVRLYTLYYPGEWYPPNEFGNPTGRGAGMSWPADFPFRFAEIRGDTFSDLNYKVIFNNIEYMPYPLNSSGIELDSSGKINEVTLEISNFDNLITNLVEDPFIAGNNSSNATFATVNGEIVSNIDPRTIPTNSLFDQSVVDSRGGTNVAFDFSSTEDVNGTWTSFKQDSRDLLGAVIEIKSTFANFLDVWPEYSTVKGTYSNVIEVVSTLPYRVGDTLRSNNNVTETTKIIRINGNLLITNNTDFNASIVRGDKIYIVNDQSDSDSFTLDSFKVNNLQTLDERSATFGLSSWLQYFKLQLPKRRFLKNTCPWVYKGAECQYPEDGTGTIPGSTKKANGFFNRNNQSVNSIELDVCARSPTACDLRNNSVHFGGFRGTGRTIPR